MKIPTPAEFLSTVSFVAGSIAGAALVNGSVSDSKISGVDGSKITDNTIASAKLLDSSISSAKIADGTIATADLADGAVSGAKLGVIPYAFLYHTADQTFTNNTREIQGFDTEDSDNAGMHFTSAAALTGTVSKTATSATLTGSGTSFTTELSIGQVITVPGTSVEQRTVTAIASNTSLTVNKAFGQTASGQTATRTRDALALPYAGIWRVEALQQWANGTTGKRESQLWRNGAGTGGELLVNMVWNPITAASQPSFSLVWAERAFDLWDNVDLRGIQNQGSGLASQGQSTHGSKIPYLLAVYRGKAS